MAVTLQAYGWTNNMRLMPVLVSCRYGTEAAFCVIDCLPCAHYNPIF